MNIYKQNLCLFEITDNLAKHVSRSENRLSQYAILWVKKGEGSCTVDFREFPLQNNSLFFLTPFQPFSFSDALAVSATIILFDSEFFCLEKHGAEVGCNGILFSNIYDLPYFTVEDAPEKYFSGLLLQMIEEMRTNHVGKIDMLVAYLKQFLIYATRVRKEQSVIFQHNQPWTQENECIAKLRSLIDANFKAKKTVPEYATMLNMSGRNLSRIVSKFCNRTIIALIQERVIIEAKRYLHYSNHPVKEIAFNLGFDDPAYFSRYFKKYAGMSPEEYRKA